MRKLVIGLVALAVALAYTSAPVYAADAKVTTKIFLDKPGTKTKWLSKDTSVTIDPNDLATKVAVCTADDPNGTVIDVGTLTPNGAGTVFKSKTGCKITLVKPGKLTKFLCKPGANLPLDPNQDIGITVKVGSGSTRICGQCGGTVKGNPSKLSKRKDCSAPAACLCNLSPSGAFMEFSSF
jgi:hypothetical protein